jgi:tRNA(Phe) wybutosine-synthesizing methylase Tyw3
MNLLSTLLFFQDQIEMADQLRADGKIWVVVAVVALVFTGIIAYLVRLDRQIGKLEKDIKNTQPKASEPRLS